MKRKSSKASWAIALVCSLTILAGGTGVIGKNNDDPNMVKLSSCIEIRRQACKRDPMKNHEFCDTEQATQIFEMACRMFGTPEEQKANLPTISWPKL
jgi:hypothetical protein